MPPMRKILLAGTSLAALALAACGGGGGKAVTPTPQPPQPMRLEDQFGTGFGVSFRAERNTEPTDPQAPDIGPLDLTAEPREVS